MAKKPNTAQAKPARAHRATYTRNNRGIWQVCVTGPHADKFMGKEVPVAKVTGEETMEKLTKRLYVGVSTLEETEGQPMSFYAFEPKPRDEDEIEF